MSLTALQKGKGRALPDEEVEEPPSEDVALVLDSESSEESDSDSDLESSASDSEEEITQEFLNSLLEKARRNAQEKSSASRSQAGGEEDVMHLLDETNPEEPPLPPLDPGDLPAPYLILDDDASKAGPSKIRDPEVEQVEKTTPAAPAPPPEVTKAKKALKKEKKAEKAKTAGAAWYDLPAPAEADLPRLYREVEALRLRNQLDPKRFYRKEAGEGRGIKGLPKHFAIGTIIPTNTPFGTASADNLSRAQRKRTLVDELVDDAESKSYAKKKFKELQTVRGAKGRGTLAQKKAMRRPKW
ncbi:Fcf2-domain-containing protein [Obba rivulosa]|uniref:Fcf2-domain-containing protein n=1 Tax=Obba rivulosa TaxID=1052685 RepID=A0A8E2APT5_9APHY|nr:Fcf2-domain-containing protein [Obba rivulosa]